MMLFIVSIACSFLFSLSAQEIPNKFEVAKQKLLYEGNSSVSKKELMSVFYLAKKHHKNPSASDEKIMNEVLTLLGEYAGASYRDLFKMCKAAGLDCSYYKAKTLEMQGNAGSAMELYLDAGNYEDYLRLKAYSGEDLKEIAKKYGLKEEVVLYYQGLLYVAKGEWEKGVNTFSSDKLKNNAKATFYLGYALLMQGNNDKVAVIVQDQSEKINYFEKLEYKRLKGLLLYAENKQFEAFDVLKEVLAATPNDFLSKRYLAHIYYRTGWFNKAEKIYSDLISKEWRDTELYYLLSERAEMRVRNLKFDMAKEDAERIIREYPSRKDFVVNQISLLLSYGNIQDSMHFVESLSLKGDSYEQSLHFFAQGLISEFNQDYVNSNAMFKSAMKLFPSPEYNAKVLQSEQDLKEPGTKSDIKFSCSEYKADPKYYITKKADGIYNVRLPLLFVYDGAKIYIKDKEALWVDKIQKVWSVEGIKLEVDSLDVNKRAIDGNGKYVRVGIVPWPSSFYLKRVSSHEWSVLTPPSVIAHEAGHLLGLDDEYYERDQRILSRNKGRHIGPVSSIMRNMYNGKPEKMHIHFILSPLKCD